jgi:hypothetical protein
MTGYRGSLDVGNSMAELGTLTVRGPTEIDGSRPERIHDRTVCAWT